MEPSSRSSLPSASLFAFIATAVFGCSAPSDTGSYEETLDTVTQGLAGQDLAEAFSTFQAQVSRFSLDAPFRIGFGPHPGLNTEAVSSGGFPAKGEAVLDFETNTVTATLDDVGTSGSFDLYFVKNVEGSGRTVRPESGDIFLRVGGFTTAPPGPGVPPGRRVLEVELSQSDMRFDIDLVVVTRAGSTPATSRIAVGARTLLEKRLFRERFGQASPPVTGTLSNEVESTDELVRRGAQLFFKEQFGGNGRTCGTCHRATNNLTIDPLFISTLPPNDPLFVAELNPALAQLEDSTRLRNQGLILENVDGFSNPGVLRSVPHTFALQTSLGPENALTPFPNGPPDHRLGWGGDGAPGRGTIAEFAFGAIIQHFPKDLQRRPGIDFRVPTQAELDALEAFQLFSGRQKFVDATALTLRDSRAQNGRQLFLTVNSGGKCTNCHFDLGQIDDFSSPPVIVPPNLGNLSANQGVKALTPDLPNDDGFLSARVTPDELVGDVFPDQFNIPPLIEAADTGPFFHNNVFLSGIEGAVSFYVSPTFQATPVGDALDIQLTQGDIDDIGAFLRVLNAAENVRQVRKRVTHVRDVRSSGNTAILEVAIADTQDALDDLTQKNLNPVAVHALNTIKQTLIIAKANADSARPPFMANALVWLGLAKDDLFIDNPNDEF